MEGDTLLHDFWNVIQVPQVCLGNDDVLDLVPFGGHRLFPQSTDGQHPPGKGKLAGHGGGSLHGLAGQQGHQGGGDGDTRRGAVLGCGSLRHVDVDGVGVEPATGLDALLLNIGTDPAHGDGGGLLHHVAKLSSEAKALLAGNGCGLNQQGVAAHAGPGKADGGSRNGGRLDVILVKDWSSQIFFCSLLVHRVALGEDGLQLLLPQRKLAVQLFDLLRGKKLG